MKSIAQDLTYLTATFRDAGLENKFRKSRFLFDRRLIISVYVFVLSMAFIFFISDIFAFSETASYPTLQFLRAIYASITLALLLYIIRSTTYGRVDALSFFWILFIITVFQIIAFTRPTEFVSNATQQDFLLIIAVFFLLAIAPKFRLLAVGYCVSLGIAGRLYQLNLSDSPNSFILGTYTILTYFFGAFLGYILFRFHQISIRRLFYLSLKNREHKTKLSETETQYQSILKKIPLPFSLIDEFGHIVFSNEAFNFMVGGKKSNSFIGTKLDSIIPFKLRDIEDTDRMLFQEEKTYEVLTTTNGEKIAVRVSSTPFRFSHGAQFGFLIEDVRQQKLYENQIRVDMERAEKENQYKSSFLATMSHEIRTPLHVIVGTLEIFDESNFTNSQKKHIRRLRKSGEFLLALVSDVLDLQRIESGKIPVNIIPTDISLLCANSADTHFFLAETKGISCYKSIDNTLPSNVMVDGVKVTQIINNLLSNAVKFTREGEIHFRVVYHILNKTNQIEIEVRDTGVGVPKDVNRNMLDAYVQGHAGPNSDFQGAGIGLTITKKLTELLDGTLSFTSSDGVGTIANVIFPVTPVEDTSIEPPADSTQSTVQKISNILVLEDYGPNQTLMKEVCELLGVGVTVVENGKLGLEDLMINHSKYGMVITDINMPIMSGIEFAKEFRGLDLKIPLIAVTGDVFTLQKDELKKLGISDILTKPFGISELKKTFLAYDIL